MPQVRRSWHVQEFLEMNWRNQGWEGSGCEGKSKLLSSHLLISEIVWPSLFGFLLSTKTRQFGSVTYNEEFQCITGGYSIDAT